MDDVARYRSEYLLTSAAAGIIADGIVEVADGAVVRAGPTSSIAPSPSDTRLSGLLMPALVNAHAHTPMTLFRGAGEGLPVDQWLERVMWPREARLVADDVAAGMLLGAVEQLTNGTTTTHEMYFHPAAMADACARVGMRVVVSPPFIEAAAFESLGTIDDQIEVILAMVDRHRDDPFVDVGLGPHSAYAVSAELLARTAVLADDHDLRVHIHLAELPAENALVSDTGATAARVLDGLGLLGPRTVAAHGVWLDDADLDLIASRGASIVHCPVSNARHGMGTAPVAQMRTRGITVGLGTDGPASQTRVDMFEAMRTAMLVARLRAGDGAAMDPVDALTLATSGSAAALGRDDLGRLEPGCRADMVRVDLDAPSMGPIVDDDDVLTSVVWAGSREAVADVWVDGDPVVTGGTVAGLDIGEIRRDVTARARRLATA